MTKTVDGTGVTELPRLFTDFNEVKNRPNFDPTADITVESFEYIISPYSFPKVEKDQKCQVRKHDGYCGTEHQHGFIGKTKNGKEVLLGSCCGAKYFNADHNFKSQKAKLLKEIRITDELNRLSGILSEKDAFFAHVEQLLIQLKFLRESINEVKEQLPSSVVTNHLQHMPKTGNRAVTVQFEYVEIDENNKKITSWIDKILWNISGVEIWNYPPIGRLFTDLREISALVDTVQLKRNAGDRKLKAWADKLSELPQIELEINKFQSSLRAFKDHENIQRLIFITSNHHDREKIAKLALKLQPGETSTKSPRQLISEMSRNIRISESGRNFR